MKTELLQKLATTKEMNPEVIRAFTPLFLAAIGGAVGMVVLIQPNLSEGQWAAGLGLAGTAIAGAAGLAQTTKNESNITGQNAQVKVENTHPTSNEKAAG